MGKPVVLFSIPGLRQRDVSAMPSLRKLTAAGQVAELVPSFPCVTCPVQANMTTGKLAREHGVVANGFFDRRRNEVTMWTSPNDCILAPQIWDRLAERKRGRTSAVWFPLHSKHCGADYVCTPAPVHNPDGTESLWCFTRPAELYGTLRDAMGHFPLKHFWGPLAGIPSTAWIADSAVHAARAWRPDFFNVYLPHLDYAAQRTGPDSPAALRAVTELDDVLGKLVEGFLAAYDRNVLWLVAGEYAITAVDHVIYPNRVLREAGLLAVREEDDGEHLDLAGSRAWALADHQFAHVFIGDASEATTKRVADRFAREPGIGEVLVGEGLARYGLDHERSGRLVLVARPNSWLAYSWWYSDDRAPAYAKTVDIHRKPGYDPGELHFDPATKSIPLDATLVRGSHGAPAVDPSQRTVLLSSEPGLFSSDSLADTEVFGLVMKHFGIDNP